MNILVITPHYYIEGRENLIHDTSAVHYLIRPWSKEHNVLVVNTYGNSIRHLFRYLSAKERHYLKKGYFYRVDNVCVGLTEHQSWIHQRTLNKKQIDRTKKFILNYMQDMDFVPELIVTHIPSIGTYFDVSFFPETPKVAVLHETDRYICERNPNIAKELGCYKALYARSKKIQNHFREIHPELQLKAEIVTSGAPTDNIEQRVPHKPEVFQIVYAGKLIKRKNVDKIIEALSLIGTKKSFELSIYGEGPEEDFLKKIAAESRIAHCIKFNKYVNREALQEIFKKSDLFIMPSTGETFGLVYVEAMINGCIPVGTKGEGIDGIIQEGTNGFLVTANDVNELAETVLSVMNLNEHEYEALVLNTQQCGLENTEEKAGYRYLELISRVLCEK